MLENPAVRERASGQRTIVGFARIAAAILIFAAIVTQIVDQLVNDAFVPAEYFSYFTIESSFINVVVLSVGGVLAIRWLRDPELYTAVRMSVVTYAVVTAGVYNGLLRNLPPEGYQGLQWPGELMHVWVPAAILLDWLLSRGRARLGWTALRVVIAYPILWLVYIFVRGAVTAWYPYPFLEPETGLLSISLYVVGIAAFILGIAAIAIALTRRRVNSA